MATVIIKNKQREVILDTKIVSITPLGFECEISQETTDKLRDECGRLMELGCELYLDTSYDPACILGSVEVHSVRRVSQALSILTTRFTDLEQGAYQCIAEYISNCKVVSLAQPLKRQRA